MRSRTTRLNRDPEVAMTVEMREIGGTDVLRDVLDADDLAVVQDRQRQILLAMREIVDVLSRADMSPEQGLLAWQELKTQATAVHLEWTRHLLDARERYAHELDLEAAAAVAAADLATYDGLVADFRDRLGGYADPAQRAWASHQVVTWLEAWAGQIRAVRSSAVEQAVLAGASPGRMARLLGVTRQAVNQWRREALRSMTEGSSLSAAAN